MPYLRSIETVGETLRWRVAAPKAEKMLNVLLTVDTEHWPRGRWPSRPLPRPYADYPRDYERDILGRTDTGDYGLPYLLNSLSRHDLKAVFFVESLHASTLCPDPLRRTVRMIRAAEQDIQLHVHTEWLSEITSCALPSPYRQNMRDFNVSDQTRLIRVALRNLQAAGAPNVVALRAGNMGGNLDTLSAAKAAGLAWDMSLDLSEGHAVHSLIQDQANGDIDAAACPTIALSCVEDYPGHFRPAQLTALSFDELQHAMFSAERESFSYFVILLHSFELVSRGSLLSRKTRAHKVNIRRWDQLCDLLHRRRDVFRTITSQDLLHDGVYGGGGDFTRTRPIHTLIRYAEQVASRLVP